MKPKVEHYNYDYYAGVHYVFDCSRPVGSRVTELSVNGRPVADGDIFTACLSSYRASGTGGYDGYVGCRSCARSARRCPTCCWTTSSDTAESSRLRRGEFRVF